MSYRYCKTLQCPNLIPVGQTYCDECNTENNRQVDRKRGNSADRGYGNSRWRKLRKVILNRNPFCAECAKIGRTVIATVVDHIEPHRGDKKLMWDESNLQPLCAKCHNRKTATEDGGFGNKRK